MTRGLLLVVPLASAGCAIDPPPPAPDPIEGGTRAEGRLDPAASPAQAAFCVSREVPLSLVLLTRDGAAVRPAPGTAGIVRPDYALLVRRTGEGVAWVRQVGAAESAASAAAADRLDRALADCAPAAGDGA